MAPKDASMLSYDALCEIMSRSIENRPFVKKEEFLSALNDLLGAGDLLDLHTAMVEKYGIPHMGTSRVTYMSKSAVFKVPISPDGFRYNDFEACLVAVAFAEKDSLGMTRMVFKNDIPIVAMEKIEPASFQEIKDRLGEVPDWVYGIDMQQVGFSQSGILKAYDYADLMGP